jgi:hypothetical protein
LFHRPAGAVIIWGTLPGGRARVAGLPPANFRGPSGTGMALPVIGWFMGENGCQPWVQAAILVVRMTLGFMKRVNGRSVSSRYRGGR